MLCNPDGSLTEYAEWRDELVGKGIRQPQREAGYAPISNVAIMTDWILRTVSQT
jgi:hypothetical protein